MVMVVLIMGVTVVLIMAVVTVIEDLVSATMLR